MKKIQNKFLIIGILTLISINSNIVWAKNKEKSLKIIKIHINSNNNPGYNTRISNDFQEEVVRLVNIERRKRGITPLSISNKLSSAATIRANELTQKFSHTRPNGRSYISAVESAGYAYSYVGENIAAGQKRPQDVMNTWMNSAGHRANILNPNYTEIGIGISYTQNNIYGTHWIQLFGKSR